MDIIRPLVTKNLSNSLFDIKNINVSELNLAFENLFNDIKNSCIIILRQRDVGKYSFIKNSIWKQIRMQLEKKQSKLFFPRFTNVFHAHYSTTLSLFRNLQSLCIDDGVELYHDQDTVTFRQKWKVFIYFQLRFQEIAGALEQNLLFECIENEKFKTKAANSLYDGIMTCWDENVWLPDLTHKFFKLNLEVLGRFVSWVREGMEKWEDASLLLALLNDISSFNQQDFIMNLVPAKTKISSTRLEACFGPILNLFISLEEELFESLVKHVVIECGLVLQEGVGRIKSRYQYVEREVPSIESEYVVGILDPLIHLEKVVSTELSLNFRQKLMFAILEQVTGSYEQRIRDLLAQIEKNTKLLKRLARKVSKEGMSDELKIKMQLKLDVEAYTKLLHNASTSFPVLGEDFSVNEMESFKNLQKLSLDPETTI